VIVISHRGNIRGPVPDKENRPSYIDCAIGNGYHVEIDIRSINDELWLGHDEPQYKIDHNWLDKRRNYLWLHCKNLEAAKECWAYHSFCHTADPFTYTSTGKIWLHDLSMRIDNNTIIPLINKDEVESFITVGEASFGICTDYPHLLI
jgi:hypothetical protein